VSGGTQLASVHSFKRTRRAASSSRSAHSRAP
jgi:hypothetical protein